MTRVDVPEGLERRLQRALEPTYQLLRPLGRGGMGTVFLAREPALKRLVAVKVLLPEMAADPEAHARFEREAQAVAALSHPHVVGIFGVGQLDDLTPYFVMQYVEGMSLADRLEAGGPLPMPEAKRIVAEVASALAAAHAKGIVHRDIKPANVLQDEASGRVLVSDFGLAAVDTAASEAADMRLTQTGMRVGTPQYMSPEQLLLEPVTDRTDMYALGLLAYELVAGAGPFAAVSPSALIAAHLRDTPPPLSSVRPEVDAEYESLVTACLAKEAAARPSAADVAMRLAPSGVGVLEWPPPGTEALQGGAGRHARWLWWSAGTMVTAMATFTAFGTRMTDARTSGLGMLLLAAIVFGAVAFVVRLRLLLADVVATAALVRAGYAWRTLAEVACDRRGDTGSLVSGTQTFTGLDAAVRGSLRRMRVLSGLSAVAAPIVAPGLALAWLVLGGRGAGTPAVMGAAMVAPLALAVLLGVARRVRERALVSRRPRQRAPGPLQLEGLASGWYAGLARATGTQASSELPGRSFAPTPQGRRPRAGLVLATMLAAAAVLAMAVLLPLALLPFEGAWVARLAGVDLVTATQTVARMSPRWELAPAVDASITADDAAVEHLTALTAARGTPWPVDPRRRPAPDIAPVPRLAAGSPLFGGLPSGGLPPVDRLFPAAQSFTPEELAFLESVVRHPVWAHFDRLARASVTDDIATFWRVPLSAEVTAGELLVPYGAEGWVLVYANAARAAYFAATGQQDSARAALRSGFGYARVVANGTFETGLWYANGWSATTLAAVEAYGRLHGGPEAERARALADSTRLVDAARTAAMANSARPAVSANALRTEALRNLRNARAPLPSRFGMLASLSVTQCASIPEALFGPAPDFADALRYARDSLARFESERELVIRIARAPEDLVETPWAEEGTLLQSAGQALAFAGRVLGSRRLQGCAKLLGGRV